MATKKTHKVVHVRTARISKVIELSNVMVLIEFENGGEKRWMGAFVAASRLGRNKYVLSNALLSCLTHCHQGE